MIYVGINVIKGKHDCFITYLYGEKPPSNI